MKKLSSAAIITPDKSGRTSAIQECAPDSIRGAVVPPSAPHPLCKENSRFKIQDLKPEERPIIFLDWRKR